MYISCVPVALAYIIQLTNSMELSSPWDVASCSATQEFPNILWNLNVQYCVHKSPPLFPVLKESVQRRGPLWHFAKHIFLRPGFVSPTLNLHAGGPPVVGCPRLLVQCIRSYSPFLEAFSSVRYLRMYHSVMTRGQLMLGLHYLVL
jgi:hypothetical protein